MNLGYHITDILGNIPNLKGMDCQRQQNSNSYKVRIAVKLRELIS
jgi:hypothetical protein